MTNNKEIRVNISPTHTAMSTYHLWDKALSLKAKGLLSQMLSLPKEWDYSIKGLVEINKESMDSIGTALRELKDNGYLTVTKITPNKDNNGRYKYIYDVYELPQNKQIQEGEKQPLEIQDLEFPFLRKRKEAKEKEIYICDSCDSYSLFKEDTNIDSAKDNDSANDTVNNSPKDTSTPREKIKKFIPPTVEEVREYCESRNNGIDPEHFVDFYSSKGWMIGKNKMKDWKAAVRTWENKNKEKEREKEMFNYKTQRL